MLHAQRDHVGRHVVVVGAGAVEAAGVHGAARVQARIGVAVAGQADGGHAAVRHIALLDVQHVQVGARVGVQSEGERRCDAPAVIGHAVAAGDAGVLHHGVEPEGRAAHAGQALVPVHGGALVAARARTQRGAEAVGQAGLLGDHVDGAGGRAAAVVGAGRALGDFHLLGVEHVARDGAHVAHAVHIDAVGGVEAAHVDGITRAGVAVLARVEGAGAGHVAQRLGQRGGALFLQHLLLDDGDGLRRVHQRLRELGGGDLCGFVAGAARAFDGHFLEAGRGPGAGRLCLGHGRQAQGGQGRGCSDDAGRRRAASAVVFAAFDVRVGVRHG